ncbi:MAG: hypothetical protein R3211_08135 [Balneolaceae bacterium]|nr:hypothetical protein [Balneolaceae bacterium]
MMKSGRSFAIVLMLTVFSAAAAQAQLRKEQSNPDEYMGPIVKENSTQVGNWSNLFNMKMSHTYSINVGSFGGQMYNMNAYTNTMEFFFSERMTGRVDISFLHSPFGNSFLNEGSGDFGGKVIIRNAELNYQLGERSHITVQFQQHPFGGFSPYSPFYQHPFYGRNY